MKRFQHTLDRDHHRNLDFGMRILARTKAIKDDIEHEGVPGIISLIQALLMDGPRSGYDLLRVAAELCHADDVRAFKTCLAALEGTCPKTCLWRVDGRYVYTLHRDQHQMASSD